MAGTKAGGKKAAKTNKERDPDFYRRIGRKGGQNGHTGGFASNPKLAKLAGAKGGRLSRRDAVRNDVWVLLDNQGEYVAEFSRRTDAQHYKNEAEMLGKIIRKRELDCYEDYMYETYGNDDNHSIGASF